MIRFAGVLLSSVLVLVLVGGVGLASPGGDRKQDGGPKPLGREDAKRILHGLEQGAAALKALGKHDEAQRLARLADELRAKLEDERQKDGERAVVERWIKGMRVGMHGLLEAGKEDLAHRLEHAVHALELGLEGRRDEEAMRIRNSAPNREEQIELLVHASKIWAELGHETRAEQVEQVARELKGKGERRDKPQREKGDRQAYERRIEAMKTALPALMEGGKRDAAELAERALHAYRVALEGRRDEEAHQIMRTAPPMPEQAEILVLAARLWKEFGDPGKAELCYRMAKEIAGKERGEREPPAREGGDRLRELEKRLEEMQRMMEELRRELERMHRER